MTRFGALTLLLFALPNSHQLNSHGSQLQRPADTVTALVSAEGKQEQFVDIDQLKAAQLKGGKPVLPLSAKVKTTTVKSEAAKGVKPIVNAKKAAPPNLAKKAPTKKSVSTPPSKQFAAIGQEKKTNFHLSIPGKAPVKSVAKRAQPVANSKLQDVMSSVLGKYKKQSVAQAPPAPLTAPAPPAKTEEPSVLAMASSPDPTPVADPAQAASSLTDLANPPANPSSTQPTQDAAQKAIQATLAKIKAQKKPQQISSVKAPASPKPKTTPPPKPVAPTESSDFKAAEELNAEALEYSVSAMGAFDAGKAEPIATSASAPASASQSKATQPIQKTKPAPAQVKKPQLAGLKPPQKKQQSALNQKSKAIVKKISTSAPKVSIAGAKAGAPVMAKTSPKPGAKVVQKILSKTAPKIQTIAQKKVAVKTPKSVTLKPVAPKVLAGKKAAPIKAAVVAKAPAAFPKKAPIPPAKKKIEKLDKAALETSSEIHQSSKILKQIKKKVKSGPLETPADEEKKLQAAQAKFYKLSEMATEARTDVMQDSANDTATQSLATHQEKLEEQKKKQLDLQWQALENEKYLDKVKQHTDATTKKIQLLKATNQSKPSVPPQALLQAPKKVDPTIEENKAFLASTTEFQDELKQKEEARQAAKDTQEIAEKQKQADDAEEKKKTSIIEDQITQVEIMKQATETQAKIEGKNVTQAAANLMDPTALDNVEPEAAPMASAPAAALQKSASQAVLSQSDLIAQAIKHQQQQKPAIEPEQSLAAPAAPAAPKAEPQDAQTTAEMKEPLPAAPTTSQSAAQAGAQAEEMTFTKSASEQQIISDALMNKAVPVQTKEQIKQIINETHPQALQEASVSELSALSAKHKQSLDESAAEEPKNTTSKAQVANKTVTGAKVAKPAVIQQAPKSAPQHAPSSGAVAPAPSAQPAASMQEQINMAVKHQLESMNLKPAASLQDTASTLSAVTATLPEPLSPTPAAEPAVSGQSLADQMASVLKGFGTSAPTHEPTAEDQSQSQQIVAQIQADAQKRGKGAAAKDTAEIAKSLMSSVQDLIAPADPPKQPDQDKISVTQQEASVKPEASAAQAAEAAAADPETQKKEEAILKTEDKLLKRLAKNEKKLEKKLKQQEKEEAAQAKKAKKVVKAKKAKVAPAEEEPPKKKAAKSIAKTKIATAQKKVPLSPPKAIKKAATENKLLSKKEPTPVRHAQALAGSHEEETAAEDAPPTYTPADFMSPDPSKADEIIIDDDKALAEHRYADDLILRKEKEIQALKKIEETGSHQLEKLAAKREELSTASKDIDAMSLELHKKSHELRSAATDLRRQAQDPERAAFDKHNKIMEQFKKEMVERRRKQVEEMNELKAQQHKIMYERTHLMDKGRSLDHEQEQLSAAGHELRNQMGQVEVAKKKVLEEIQRAKANGDAEKEERLEWEHHQQQGLDRQRAYLEASYARRQEAHDRAVREASERVQQDCGEGRSVVQRGCEYDPQSGHYFQVINYIAPTWNPETEQCEESEQQRMVSCAMAAEDFHSPPGWDPEQVPRSRFGFGFSGDSYGSFAQTARKHHHHSSDSEDEPVVKSAKQIRSEIEASTPEQVEAELHKHSQKSVANKKRESKANAEAKKVIAANEGRVKDKLSKADAVLKSLKSALAK